MEEEAELMQKIESLNETVIAKFLSLEKNLTRLQQEKLPLLAELNKEFASL